MRHPHAGGSHETATLPRHNIEIQGMGYGYLPGHVLGRGRAHAGGDLASSTFKGCFFYLSISSLWITDGIEPVQSLEIVAYLFNAAQSEATNPRQQNQTTTIIICASSRRNSRDLTHAAARCPVALEQAWPEGARGATWRAQGRCRVRGGVCMHGCLHASMHPRVCRYAFLRAPSSHVAQAALSLRTQQPAAAIFHAQILDFVDFHSRLILFARGLTH